MESLHLIGSLAAFCTTVSFVPQVIQIVTTRQTAGISLPMYVLFVSGIALWLLYGLFRQDVPLIVANAITLMLSGTVLGLKVQAVWRGRRR
jgi:MtN3 and saliva related transmembrane protein